MLTRQQRLLKPAFSLKWLILNGNQIFHTSRSNSESVVTKTMQLSSSTPWKLPHTTADQNEPKLKLLNSLTGTKNTFVPVSKNRVNFYVCGPTVYDVPHLGHARCYVCFDVFRRVLKEYFCYNVNYILNVTDVDDKIIKRARIDYLIQKYVNVNCPYSKILQDSNSALADLKEKLSQITKALDRPVVEAKVNRLENSIGKANQSFNAEDSKLIDLAKITMISETDDILFQFLNAQSDRLLIDVETMLRIAKFYENEFHSGMKRFNVASPDIITRVSDYLDEIVEFIAKLIQNGFAYESSGSVYFDTIAFSKKSNHKYPKLKPEAFVASFDGEVDAAGKRNSNDFALWKAAKSAEPFWPSPWSNGRPGWHIECSVMASHVCGPILDLHGGGTDLQFPHHANELAQSEAYFDCHQWVNYFLHVGALTVSNIKMSKSLKNYVTINDALEQYTPIQLRLLFLLNNWWETLDYNAAAMNKVLLFEKNCNEFFLIVKHYLRSEFKSKISEGRSKFDKEDLVLDGQFTQCKLAIHNAFCDSISTRDVLHEVSNLISHANIYILHQNAQRLQLNLLLLNNIVGYITSIFRFLGLQNEQEELGLPEENVVDATVDRESILMPYLTAISEFRRTIRLIAIDQTNELILRECDKLRNEILPHLGVRLEDRENHTSIKLVDPEILLKEKEKMLETKEKLKTERERKLQARSKMKEKLDEKYKTPPSEIFKPQTDKFSIFDANGIPTHDVNGKTITTRKRKFLEKLYIKHKEKHELYCSFHRNDS